MDKVKQSIKKLNKEIKNAKRELKLLCGKVITCSKCGIDFTVKLSRGRYPSKCDNCNRSTTKIKICKKLEITKSKTLTKEDLIDDFEWEDATDEE